MTTTHWEMARFMDALGFDEADPATRAVRCVRGPYGTQGAPPEGLLTIANDGASRGVERTPSVLSAWTLRATCLGPFKRVHRVVNWRRNLLSRIDPVFPTRRLPMGGADGLRPLRELKMRVGATARSGCTAFPKCRRAFPVPEVGA